MKPLDPDGRVKVLVVDDSAFARKVLRTTLDAHPRIDVVGTARDGCEALEKVVELRPDVMTLDLVMPNLDGLGVLAALPAEGAPRVVIVSMADESSELGIAALEAGAIDLVHKPTAQATDRLYELGDELVEKVLVAAAARPATVVTEQTLAAGAHAARKPVTVPLITDRRVLVIGASTGGPHAISILLRALPAEFPIPIAVTLHLPRGYTSAFAARLHTECELNVVEATDGMLLAPGQVVVARAGIHLKLDRELHGYRTRLDVRPVGGLHRPSVDELFLSVADAPPRAVLAVVLTGMGDDGLLGARAIHEHGGTILVEDESSCVVYGMPRCVSEAGLATEKVPIEGMAAAILRSL